MCELTPQMAASVLYWRQIPYLANNSEYHYHLYNHFWRETTSLKNSSPALDHAIQNLALLNVCNDLLCAESKTPAIMVLLDLTSAFDAVDHEILISQLSQFVGIQGTAHKWFQSHLTKRFFSTDWRELFLLCSSHLLIQSFSGLQSWPVLFFFTHVLAWYNFR